ncbi:MAG TPA: SHOCT domain-containing protein [Thermoanaerobaculia bacterium]|nr:SHOCT domain-containing protein [Thermoanaerobaculia bacterium]
MDTFWVILILVFVVGLLAAAGKGQARDKAKAAYEESLARLATDPTNPSLRKATLDLGRAYSNLTRNNKGVTIFDEIALMNDINAACGGTTAIAQMVGPTMPRASGTVVPALEDRLAKLVRLKEQGLISDEEYQGKRRQLLEEV